MQHYFSPSSMTFFRSDIHGEPGSEHCTLPEDAIKVSEKTFEEMLEARATGLIVSANADGQPIATPAPPPSKERLAEIERAWRDHELDSVKWLRERHRDEREMDIPTTLDQDRYIKLLSYMQALRDWPQSAKFPDSLSRPSAPDWLAAQG